MSRLNIADGTTPQADGERQNAVKVTSTPNRRAKRPRRDVETMEYLGAAARFIRAGGRRVAECDPEYELRALIELRDVLDQATADAVAGLRARGYSWADIARGTNTTREAAWQRWGRR